MLAALDELARAIARATPEQLGTAWSALEAQAPVQPERHVIFDDGVESVALVGRRPASPIALARARARKRDRLAQVGRSVLAFASERLALVQQRLAA